MLRLPFRDWLSSSRHYLRELLTIVAGILIALAFDGMADRYEERQLARDAVANMKSEIADNLGDLEDARKSSYPSLRRSLEENLAAIRMLQSGERPKVFSREILLPTVGLTSSSLETAQATGALRHMDYAEARRFADLFTLQAEFLRRQARLVDHWVATTPVGEENLFELSAPELAARAADMTIALRHLVTLQRWSNTVVKMYRSRLASGR
jgi:hypothetical protein